MNSSTAATLPLAHTSSKNQRTRASLSCADTARPPRRAAFPLRASTPFYQSMMPPGGMRYIGWRLIHLELPPIGSASECETGTDAPSSGEFSTLPDEGRFPCPLSHHTSSSPSLGTARGLAAQKSDEPSARVPPPSHPRQGGLREAGASSTLRLRLRED